MTSSLFFWKYSVIDRHFAAISDVMPFGQACDTSLPGCRRYKAYEIVDQRHQRIYERSGAQGIILNAIVFQYQVILIIIIGAALGRRRIGRV